jgi:hypothetical protein
MKYFAKFDAVGERIAGYAADGMPYTEADIREQFPAAVEITADEQKIYVTGNYIRDSETGTPVEKPTYVPTLAEQKSAKLQQIDSRTATAITGGFVSAASGEPHTYDSGMDDQLTFAAMYVASKSPDFADHPVYSGQIPIRAIPEGQTAKVVLQHDAAKMQILIDDLAQHIGSCKQQGWQLQAAVAAAETTEDLAAVTWPE